MRLMSLSSKIGRLSFLRSCLVVVSYNQDGRVFCASANFSPDQEEGNIIYMMFSATFPKSAQELATTHLRHDHVRIRIGKSWSLFLF